MDQQSTRGRDPRGLTSVEAAARLRRDGPNVLPVAAPPPAWRLLAAQLVHFFAVMLWVAGGLAIIADMPQLGAAIFIIILINAGFAFVQEWRAERAAERLRDLLPRRVLVVRDGLQREIDAPELVVGDLVMLGAGDHVSADLLVIEAHGLRVDTSTLTGESVPTSVEEEGSVFAGTFIVEGEAYAQVAATAQGTRLAGIARLTRAGHRPPSPLARELSRVVRTIALIAVCVGASFYGIALLVGLPARDGFLFAVGVTVALVPEGLLPTVTLSLARGAQRMASRQALVRRLESVETLGSTTFICTDKTGTITRNEMSVVRAWTPGGSAVINGSGYEPHGDAEVDLAALPAVRRLARAAARCSSGHAQQREGRWVAVGDPMEAALDVFARRLGIDLAADEQASPSGRRFPFDPRRRRMAVVAGDQLLVKGAPDSVLPRCTNDAGAAAALEALTARGLRVLAVAARPAAEMPAGLVADAVERDLELLGMVGLEDPPREGAAEALAACRRAGIKVAMITGDHPRTAAAIAREVGLLGLDAEGRPLVLEGRELPQDTTALGELLDRDGVVVSRVSPEEKLRIAQALRARGHVVAMTGDGVNDGPALQAADIGIAMGRSGTDVAREASDLVLLDDDFATIVAAIEQGRATFSNIRRFLTYHLTDNVAELTPFAVWALSAGQIPLAIGVLQVLCLDIGTDQLPALALGTEAPSERVMLRPPTGRHLIDGEVLRRVFFVLGPVEALVEMLAFGVTLFLAGWRPGQEWPAPTVLLAASGAAFSAVVIGQAANAFACRSTVVWPGALGWTTNRFMLVAVAGEIAILWFFLFVPEVASVLGHAPPTSEGWLVALAVVPLLLLADGLHKRFRRRQSSSGAASLSLR